MVYFFLGVLGHLSKILPTCHKWLYSIYNIYRVSVDKKIKVSEKNQGSPVCPFKNAAKMPQDIFFQVFLHGVDDQGKINKKPDGK